MLDLIRRLVKEEEGQGLVEYGLIIVLVSLAVLLGLGLVGTNLQTLFNKIAGELV